MRIHFFQHVAFESPGEILNWAKKNGYTISYTRWYEVDHYLPEPNELDMLVIMGGPMGVYDDLPWLEKEKAFIRKVIQADKKVLGICLGAQLIANVMGANVYPHAQKEIGWWPVTLTDTGKQYPCFQHFPEEQMALHWHGDTFDLPDGAVWLAQSEACPNQAFALKDAQIIGLQYHLEADQNLLSDFIANGQSDLAHEGKWVQTAEQLLLCEASLYEQNRKLLIKLLDEWAAI